MSRRRENSHEDEEKEEEEEVKEEKVDVDLASDFVSATRGNQNRTGRQVGTDSMED